MWLLLGVVLISFGNSYAIRCFGQTCNTSYQSCYITKTEGDIDGECVYLDKHDLILFGCPATMAENGQCFCSTQECINRVVERSDSNNVFRRSHGHDTSTLLCGSHHCRSDEACLHKLVFEGLHSVCEDKEKIHHFDDCQWPTSPYSHTCYCLTNACNEYILSNSHLLEQLTTLPLETQPSTLAQSTLTITQTTELPAVTTTTAEPSTTTMSMEISTLAQNTITTSETTELTTQTTSTEVCQDNPAVNCKLLDAPDFCANPFTHRYCAAYCGHCRTSSSLVG